MQSTKEVPAGSAVGLVLQVGGTAHSASCLRGLPARASPTSLHPLNHPPQDTSFYAESGGQCADSGAIVSPSGTWPVEVRPSAACVPCCCLLASRELWWVRYRPGRAFQAAAVARGAAAAATGDGAAAAAASALAGARCRPATCCVHVRPTRLQDCIVAAGYVLHLGQQPEGEVKVGDAVTTKCAPPRPSSLPRNGCCRVRSAGASSRRCALSVRPVGRSLQG